jgi:hypothetical protein
VRFRELFSRDLLSWFGFFATRWYCGPRSMSCPNDGCWLLVASLDCTGSWYYLINCKISSIDRIDRINLQSMTYLRLCFSGIHRLDPIINRMVSILKMHYCAPLSMAICLPGSASLHVLGRSRHIRSQACVVCMSLRIRDCTHFQTRSSMRETLVTYETPISSSTEMAIFTAFVSKTHDILLTSLHGGDTYMYMY